MVNVRNRICFCSGSGFWWPFGMNQNGWKWTLICIRSGLILPWTILWVQFQNWDSAKPTFRKIFKIFTVSSSTLSTLDRRVLLYIWKKKLHKVWISKYLREAPSCIRRKICYLNSKICIWIASVTHISFNVSITNTKTLLGIIVQ